MPKALKETQNIKNKKCSIHDCLNKALRSVPEQEWESAVKLAGLKYIRKSRMRISLCKEHYTQAKKHKSKINKTSANSKGFLSNSPKPTRMRV